MLMPLSPGRCDLIHCIMPGKALGGHIKTHTGTHVRGKERGGGGGGKVTEDTERNRGRNNFLVEHRDGHAVIKDLWRSMSPSQTPAVSVTLWTCTCEPCYYCRCLARLSAWQNSLLLALAFLFCRGLRWQSVWQNEWMEFWRMPTSKSPNAQWEWLIAAFKWIIHASKIDGFAAAAFKMWWR